MSDPQVPAVSVEAIDGRVRFPAVSVEAPAQAKAVLGKLCIFFTNAGMQSELPIALQPTANLILGAPHGQGGMSQ